jgi:TIR domain
MPGSNLFAAQKYAKSLGERPPVFIGNCVFVSHKREDSEMARSVADALIDLDINVWLDLDELGFSEPKTDEEHIRLTHAIEAGLKASTHMLALITPNTKGSWWVPFEIGMCRAREKPLAFLLHKEVSNLPSFMKLGTALENKHEFYDWAKELSRSRGAALYNKAAIATLQNCNLDRYIELIRTRR